MSNNNTFAIDIEVRFRDLDAMGHVNNSVFFTYFEEGRKSFSRHVFHYNDPSEFTFILAHIRCDYLKPIKLNDRITLQMWVTDVGNKSFNFGYKLMDRSDDSVVFATGESVQVCYDYRAQKSMTIPNEMRAKLLEYLRSL